MTLYSYAIELSEAKVVRQIFHWVGVDRLSIGEVVRRLDGQGVTTRTGKSHWDRSVIWGMLQNPAYMGRAAFGKTKATAPQSKMRPPRHSAEVHKKGVSVTRQSRDEWIEIPVPALVSEALFSAVQEQLEENRKYARLRRRGAAYLLQGLVVCGHCHYAYYGKPVSQSVAKGGRKYAYYRCIGTDAYRFGGQRVCDNKQIRTSRLDDLVWMQVVNLLKNPEHLKHEYERRLDLIEEGQYINLDVSALQKQKHQFEKSKSRLIDSFVEGVIEKEDFNPRLANIKSRITLCEQQITEAESQQTGQQELFLVVSRLDEFSDTVRDRLNTMDFETKREIIRGLVKRIEIWKDEIVVVFKVDPDSDPKPDTGSQPSEATEKSAEGKSMQHRPRRDDSALRGTGNGRSRLAILLEDAGAQERLDQSQNALIGDTATHAVHQGGVVDLVEACLDITLEYPPVVAGWGGEKVNLRNRVLGAPIGTEAIRARLEVRLKDRLQYQFQGGLNHTVQRGRYPKPPELAVGLGDPFLADRHGSKLLCLELGS
nr:recombinase family protein [Halomonas qijiaojingensis]